MANNNFKLDIGGMVKQVEDLNKALEQLGVLAQGVFGTLGRAADVFGGKMSTASNITSAGPSSMITPTGASASTDFDASIARGIKAQQIIKSGVGTPGSPYVYAPGSGQDIFEKHTTGHSTVFKPTGLSSNNLQQAIIDSETARLQQELAARSSKRQPDPSFVPPARPPDVKPAFGYGAKDIIRLSSQTESFGNLSKSLETLASDLSGSNREVAKSLTMLQTDLNKQMQNFQAAMTSFGSAQGDDEQKRAMAELTQAMKKLDGTLEEAQEAEKQARGISGGGGGPGGPGGVNLMEMARRWGPAGFAVASAVGAGALGTEVALRQATAGKQLDFMQANAGIAQQAFGMVMESHDMTKAENLLRYRGDMLFPGRFDYLGASGIPRAAALSKDITAQEHALLRAERNLGMFQSGVGILGGAGVAIGSLMSGGPMGLAGALFGAQQMVGGITGGIRDYYTNPLTLSEGGLTGTMMGRFATSISGLSTREAYMAEAAAKRTMEQAEFSRVRAIQDLDIQQQPGAMVGLQEKLDRQKAMQQAALLVGRNAMDYRSFDNVGSKRLTESARAKGEAMQAADEDRQRLERQLSIIPKSVLDDADAARGFVDPFGSDFNPRAQRAKIALSEKIEEKTIATNKAVNDARSMDISGGVELTDYARFGMSASERIVGQAQLDLVSGRRRGNWAQVMGLTKGGFGSFDQMIQNIGNINQIAGGEGNERRLESILVSAFSAGFDKSRMAQQFVQSSTELARVIQTTSPEEIGKKLGFAAQAFSATGAADEKSLAEAARGMAGYAQFTGQTTGLMGSLKYLGVYGGGLTSATGGSLIQASNAEQLSEYARVLSQPGVSIGNIQDRRLQDIVRLAGGTQQALAGIQGAMAGSSVQLRGVMGLNLSGNPGLLKKYGASDLDSLIEIGSKLTGAQRDEFIKDFTTLGRGSAAAAGIGEEVGMAGATQLLQASGMTSPHDQRAFDKAKREGQAKSVTGAEKNLKQFIDQLYVAEAKGAATVKAQDYFQYLSGAGEDAATKAYLDGQAITQESYSKMSPEQKKLADAEIAKIDRMAMAQNAGSVLSTMRGEQRVWVSNFDTMVHWMKPLAEKR